MTRQNLIREIARRWSDMGIPYQIGGAADLAIQTEFLDASWGSGNKKITYEASVFADEAAKTVFMYEKTVEASQGLSFGSDGESDVQVGKTLFRKIKSVQHGPNGLAYEINLDLGAIPKAVKETAKSSGWSFKTVLNRNKASYPPGFVGEPVASYQQAVAEPLMKTHTEAAEQPFSSGSESDSAAQARPATRFCSNCGSPLTLDARFCGACGHASEARAIPAANGKQAGQVAQPAPPPIRAAPQTPDTRNQTAPAHTSAAPQAPDTRKRNPSKLAAGAWIILAVLTVLVYLIASVSVVGWGLCLVILAGSFLLLRKWASKGCVTNIILWILTAVLLLAVLLFTTPGENSQATGSTTSAATAVNAPTTANATTTAKSSTASGAASTTTAAKTTGGIPDITVTYLVNDYSKNTVNLMEVNSKTQKASLLFSHGNINRLSVSDKVYALVDNRLAVISQGQSTFLVNEETYVVRYFVKGGHIYYGKDNTNASDDYFERLAMISTSGQNARDLHEMGVGQLLVDDAVYFKPNSGSEVQSLLRLNLDGTGKTTIYKGSVGFLVKSKNYLYFVDFNQNSALMRMKADGSDVKKVAEGPFKFEMAVPSQFNGLYTMATIGDTLFYINPKDGSRLYRIDDSGNTKVSDAALSRIKSVPTGEALVVTYALSSNKPGLYIWSQEGQELTRLTGETVSEFAIR